MKPEDFYKEEFAKDYELIKDLKEQQFFNFRSMMEFAEMYHTKQCAINGVGNLLKDKQALSFEDWIKHNYRAGKSKYYSLNGLNCLTYEEVLQKYNVYKQNL